MANNQNFYAIPLPEQIIQRISGISYKTNNQISLQDLRYLNVLYVDFDYKTQTGELICNKEISDSLLEIFEELYNAEYPIEQIRLIDEYNADDDLSCMDNNSSCFNFRTIANTSILSKHALGMAVDINPFYNPYVTYPNGSIRISPPGSEYYANRTNIFSYKIDSEDLCYHLFLKHGFTWGGDWVDIKDYQHFEKTL